MTKKDKPTLSDQDKRLFKEAMEGISPLKSQNRTKQDKPKRKPKLKKQPQFKDAPTYLDQSGYEEPFSGDQTMSHVRDGVHKRLLKQLKRGQLPIEARLDLHGHTVDQAEQAIIHMINEALEDGLRCVIIVHGKGYSTPNQAPVLKNKVNLWLKNHPNILAFTSAQPSDGGAGAVYVLLKRKK